MGQEMKTISVVGIDGVSALGPKAEALLLNADTILTSRRLNEMFEQYEIFPSLKDKLKVITPIAETLEFLESSEDQCAVIASGDPLFFGIGSKIMDALPGRKVELVPAVSSVQVAFARAGLAWQDAVFVSMHGSIKREWAVDDLPMLCQRHRKLAILTGGENTPEKIAKLFPTDCRVFVLERLGYPDEHVSEGAPEDIADAEFKNPNIMIVLTPETTAPVFGLNADEFRHERSLITKDEVRAVALHKLRLPVPSTGLSGPLGLSSPSGGILWDVGAGSGSVAIEARRLSPGLRVFAIEKDPARVEDIRHNAKELCAGEINVIEGEAPSAFNDLPAPDRIFIGGGGAALGEIIRAAAPAMQSGIIVVSTITIASLTEAVAEFKSLGLAPEVTSLSVSHSKDLGGREYLKAENQIFLIKVEKNINESSE